MQLLIFISGIISARQIIDGALGTNLLDIDSHLYGVRHRNQRIITRMGDVEEGRRSSRRKHQPRLGPIRFFNDQIFSPDPRALGQHALQRGPAGNVPLPVLLKTVAFRASFFRGAQDLARCRAIEGDRIDLENLGNATNKSDPFPLSRVSPARRGAGNKSVLSAPG